MKKTILILLVFIFSCKSIKVDDFEKEFLNDKFIEYIKQYRNDYEDDAVLLLVLEEKISEKDQSVYIKRILNLSFIYKNYISFWTIVDGIPVIISSKKDGYIEPKNYPINFTNLLTNHLNDDMLMYYIKYDKKNDEVFNNYDFWNVNYSILDKSSVYKFNNHGLKIYQNYSILYNKKLLKENLKTDIIKFFKVIEGGIDERKLGNGTD